MKAAVQIVLVLVVAIGAAIPGIAQSRRIQSNSAYTDKFGFYYETYLDPATPELANLGGGVVVDGVIHRFLIDAGRRVYVGYDVSVEVLPEPNTYRVTFSKLTMPPDQFRQVISDNPSGWTQLPTPGWAQPGARTVRGGEILALSLMTSAATGQKIVDYVTIQEPPRRPLTFKTANIPPREFVFAPGAARDFRVDDAALRIRGPRLTINGKFDISTTSRDTEVSGPIVYFYTANRGRFLLSLTPQPGFQKLGEVRGTALTFTIGSDVFNLVAGSPIAPGGGAFNLYVLHEPAWKPSYPFADLSSFILGAADRAEILTGK